MIDLSPNSLVHVIYFLQVAREADFMGAITRAPGERWKFTYRFRIYLDELTHDSDDAKLWCCLEHPSEDPTEIAELAERMIQEVIMPQRKEDLGPLNRVVVKGNGVDAIAALGKEPWAHLRVEGPAAGEA